MKPKVTKKSYIMNRKFPKGISDNDIWFVDYRGALIPPKFWIDEKVYGIKIINRTKTGQTGHPHKEQN